MIRRWLESILTRLQLGEYITLDCRGGECVGCETCSHYCHQTPEPTEIIDGDVA